MNDTRNADVFPALARARAEGDAPEVRRLLGEAVRANRALVRFVAARFGLARDDEALAEGLAVLLRAARGFDPARETAFSTYACGALINAFRRLLSARRRRAAREMCESDWSSAFGGGDRGGGWRSAPTLDPSVEFRAPEDGRTAVDELLSDPMLDEWERLVLECRYGSDRRMTLGEVADVIGKSRERVRQIERAGLGKLRRGWERAQR
jgi:RNA polymerase sigma factor (sigma-70 family)